MILSKGQTIMITISDFGVSGEGVGKCGDFVLFVDGAVPGDVIMAEIYDLKKSYGFAKTVDFIKHSTEREEPRCKSFSNCGGCSFLHIGYEAELKYKKKKVNDAIKRIGGIDFEIDEIFGMKQPYFYRNKAIYHVGADKSGKPQIGFYGSKSNKIAPVYDCVMFGNENNNIIEAFKLYMVENGVVSYDNKTGKGLVKSLIIRKSSYTGDIHVCVEAASRNIPNRAGLVYHLTEAENKIKGITLSVMKDKNGTLSKGEMKFIWGDSFITDKIGKYKFKISVDSFFQVNTEMAELLYEKTIEYAAVAAGGTIIDAYAGTGTITTALSESAGNVIGIELNSSAVSDAEENAAINGKTNITFIKGDTAEILYALAEEGIKPECVVLDPPRSGCGKRVVDGLKLLSPSKIVYISCNPATLARDLREISALGYSAKKGACFDMFARSAHVETVVLLSKLKSSAFK